MSRRPHWPGLLSMLTASEPRPDSEEKMGGNCRAFGRKPQIWDWAISESQNLDSCLENIIYIYVILRNYIYNVQAPYLSHIRREKSHHPHGTAAIQKVTSGSGKSHQGRRITMAQPVSSIIGDVVKSSRSIAHSDDFEGHKLIQTNSRQLILLDLNILY